MLSLELIGVIGLLFGFMIWGMVVTQRERRSASVSQSEFEPQKVVKRV